MADLSITASQVLSGADADFYIGIAGATIVAGKAVYLDSISGKLLLADANGSIDSATARGIALHAASDGQPLKVQIAGSLTLGAGAAPVLSTIYIVSGTAGGIAPAADLASGWWTTVLGVGIGNNAIRVHIFVSNAQKA